MTDNNVQFEHIASFLLKEGLAGDADNIRLTPLSGDGSSRRFYNVRTESASFCAVLPAGDSDRGLSEAQATFNIGTHLKKRGIPVPKIHAFDPDSGLIIFEDLGTTLLHDHIAGQNENSAAHFSRDTVDLYSEIIEILLSLRDKNYYFYILNS